MPPPVPRARPDGAGREGAPWLLLIHQLPPKPDYFRVKVGRRLQRVGAVAIKNSVYALPQSDEAYEDLQWIVREIVEGGGEASVCEASFLDGLTNGGVVALFREARDRDYSAIAEVASRVAAEAQGSASGGRGDLPTGELTRLRRRLAEVAAIDFFGAPGGPAAEAAVARAEAAMREAARRATPRREPSESRTATPVGELESLRGRVWVTRRGVHVDRIASAWLIRRFLDPTARFKFVPAAGYVPAPGELRFDMFDAEFTHEGDRCTFETLVGRFRADDPALRALGEIVHDVDCKDGKFGRVEAGGVAALIDGIAAAHADDAVRLERGAAVFSDLYEHFAARAGDRGPQG
jgi:hypothetical protein